MVRVPAAHVASRSSARACQDFKVLLHDLAPLLREKKGRTTIERHLTRPFSKPHLNSAHGLASENPKSLSAKYERCNSFNIKKLGFTPTHEKLLEQGGICKTKKPCHIKDLESDSGQT
ncbi:hypothetical protein C4D60_Mb07t27480 [Musa balbisiana]|uniref:Uncharacterized protein n=1 Tax=Musa balbisiana TaxID=52838 RepID=A0A4S8JIF0_MUSBA|nr:hypothetical protein C4D60_Mb07t27480 [Musa balbisiana]